MKVDRNKKVVIEERSSTKDEYGQLLDTWSTKYTLWGAIEPLSGREYFTSVVENSEIKVRIRVEYRSDITADMRVTWDSKIYDIQDVINYKEKNEEIQLLCKEGVTDG